MDVSDLVVISPIGGEAKRLKPLTAEISKACVRIVNRPMIEISMMNLASQGVKLFIFGVKGYLNYKSLHDYFGSGYGMSKIYNISPRIHIKYQPNEEDTGSADSLRINVRYYDLRSPILIMQSDNIFDLDIKKVLEYHQRKRALMTIVLKEVEEVSEYGVAELDGDNRIKRFVEKPKKGEEPTHLANTGLYLFSPEIRDILLSKGVEKFIADGRFDCGNHLIPYLIEEGYGVYGYEMNEEWHDVGSPVRYLAAMNSILNGQLKYLKDVGPRVGGEKRIWIQGRSEASIKRKKIIVDKCISGKLELIEPVLIGRHCQIGEGTRIKNSSIDNYTIIKKGADIENSAIMDRVIIGECAKIKNSAIGRHCVINSSRSNPTIIENISVLGDEVTIGEGYKLNNTRVWPHLKIGTRKVYVDDLIRNAGEIY